MPAVAVEGVVTVRVAAVAGLTVMLPLVPVIEDVTVSRAVTVRLPAVLSSTVKVPVPFTNVALAGIRPALSVLVIATVPV